MDRAKSASPAADKRADFLKEHPELKEQIEKLKAMAPEERQAWMKEHPELREKLMQRAQTSEVTPKKREDFLKEHPELKEQIEKLKAMTPEERQAWVKEHPELAKKIMPAMREAAGSLKSRNFTSAKSSKTHPGAPDGDYMILEYSTAFDKKPKAAEVTPDPAPAGDDADPFAVDEEDEELEQDDTDEDEDERESSWR
jgi:2-oxo-4-hydroxy-4-carboxy--5-ureidoimidazoline (OHCU) decarboxylase